jgi:hypothetical protein
MTPPWTLHHNARCDLVSDAFVGYLPRQALEIHGADGSDTSWLGRVSSSSVRRERVPSGQAREGEICNCAVVHPLRFETFVYRHDVPFIPQRLMCLLPFLLVLVLLLLPLLD